MFAFKNIISKSRNIFIFQNISAVQYIVTFTKLKQSIITIHNKNNFEGMILHESNLQVYY